jgi:hypothetical protein
VVGSVLGAGDIGGGGASGGGGPSSPVYGTGNGGPGCFVAGTPVLMADGSQMTIETVRAGDRIMTFDGRAGTVLKAYVRESDHVLEIRYLGWDEDGLPILRRLETTEEHFFWVKEENMWMPARDLLEGDTLSMPGRQEAEVTEIWRLESPATVYSLDVDEYESFYANGVLVQQKCGADEASAVEATLREYLNREVEPEKPPLEGNRSEGGVQR